MRLLRFHIVMVLLLAFAANAYSQRVRYRDVLEIVVNATETVAIEKLNDFLSVEPDHANANLRLAVIYVNKYKSVDPLTDNGRGLGLADRARQRLVKSKVLVTEKEYDRNEEDYLGVLQPGMLPGFASIDEYINKELADAGSYVETIPAIYSTFKSTVAVYDNAIKSFASINGRYSSLKEIYLLYNPNMESELERLKSSYEETITKLNEYQSQIAVFPIHGHNQKYVINNIGTYRLDGLVTQSDFLIDKIELWNYGKWVDDIKEFVKSEIVPLRASLESEQLKMFEAIKKGEEGSLESAVKLDKGVMFKLQQFDFNTALVPLLRFQELKQDLLLRKKSEVYFDTAQDLSMQRKLGFYNDMMHALRSADSVANEIITRFDEKQLARHANFLAKYFNGASSVEPLANKIIADNKEAFESYVTKIRTSIIGTLIIDDDDQQKIAHKRIDIPLYVASNPDSLEMEVLVTTHKLLNSDGTTYLAGLVVNDKKVKNREVFLTRINVAGAVDWFKTIDVEIDSAGPDSNHVIGDLQVTQEGCALLIRSIKIDSSAAINSLLYVGDDGNNRFLKRIDVDDYPRKINYSESSSSFLISFHGDVENQPLNESGNLISIKVDNSGEIIWKKELLLSGNLVDVINLRSGHMMIGNYTKLQTRPGRTLTPDSETGIYLVSLDEQGEVLGQETIEDEDPFHVSKVYKVNDKNINLIGLKQAFKFDTDVTTVPDSRMMHVITTSGFKTLFSTLN